MALRYAAFTLPRNHHVSHEALISFTGRRSPFRTVQGEFKEDRTYTVRFRPAMDEVLHLIEDPDLRGVFTTHPQRHYISKRG